MGEAPGDIVQGVGGVGISGEVEEEERRSEDGLSVGSSDGGDDPAVRHLIFNTDFDEQETCIGIIIIHDCTFILRMGGITV